MNILALESYYGLSHKAFIDGWMKHSRHNFTLLTLPGNKWKWRMRHSAITFAEQTNKLLAKGQSFDAVFCSDMLNFAEYLGLCPGLKGAAKIAYFHENQLTYPNRYESERDYQYVLTNMTTMLVADTVWFNSAFHRDEFLSALKGFLKRMPDNQHVELIEEIKNKALIHPPGIRTFESRQEQQACPLKILWAARWEHDKNPDDFFAAIKELKAQGVDFRLSVLGESFRDVPEVFGWAKEYFAEHIDHFGYQPTAEDYRSVLASTDVFISTANHEFFGISALEAISAGNYPLLPNRLAYPEIIEILAADKKSEFLYDMPIGNLVEKLVILAGRKENGKLFSDGVDLASAANRFCYKSLAAEMDDSVEMVSDK